MENSVIVIVGPTCSGKTSLGINLAELLNTEIISADSRQFYKKLNIGTAKPSVKELKRKKHHFVNSLNPEDDYNVSRYSEEAQKVIDRLLLDRKIPIIVGGSGLYIKTLIDGIVVTADKDDEYREKLLRIKSEHGINKLYQMLEEVDTVSSSKMLPQNWKRVMRALEVIHITGKPIWQHHQQQSKSEKYIFRQFGLDWNREKLYQNINNRVDEMISNGLVEEVKQLVSEGYDEKYNSLNTVGYKETILFLKEEITLERMIELIKRNTRRYAKRQMTWFRKDERINWIKINAFDDLEAAANSIYGEFKPRN